jgi:Fe-S-cluster containining protein
MKDALWLACKRKTCCYASIVVPSGRDVWRIARALDAPPWSFLRVIGSPEGRPDAFRLVAGGPAYRLVLAKQRSRRAKSMPPCIFLTRTPSGHHRCGLGELRPRSCASFPSELVDGVLCVRNDGGCTCRTWTLADVDLIEETRRVEARQAEAVEYHRVVAIWNARVEAEAPPEGCDFAAYCAYLLDAYDALDCAPAPDPEARLTSVGAVREPHCDVAS